MKFAFSTVSCPQWDLATVAARAKEYGYDGVEVRGFLNEPSATASDIFLTDPRKARETFEAAGVKIACLASSVAFKQNRKQDAQMARDVMAYVDTARAVGCDLVKVFDTQIKAGQTRGGTGSLMGDWLLPLGDYAAERGVTLVVENALSFRSAKELWAIMDRISHPAIGVCWDVFNAGVIGERPAVSVPLLNSRIQYAQVQDGKLGPLGVNYCKLGDGDIQVQNFLIRLMGIGYGGWVTFEWEKAWLPGLAEPEEVLPDAIQKMRQWTKPQDDGETPGSKPAGAAKGAVKKPAATAAAATATAVKQ
jgi:sugar phosphate isomerase/epimerase